MASDAAVNAMKKEIAKDSALRKALTAKYIANKGKIPTYGAADVKKDYEALQRAFTDLAETGLQVGALDEQRQAEAEAWRPVWELFTKGAMKDRH